MISNCNTDYAFLLSPPVSGPAGCADISIAKAFHEPTPGCYEAKLALSELLPAFAGGHLFLCFSRTGCLARLRVTNECGREISRTHYGSFTDWQLELTSLIENQESVLTVSLQLEEDLHTLSPYQIRGILGDIRLVSLPEAYFTDFSVRSVSEGGQWFFLLSCPAALPETPAEVPSEHYSVELWLESAQNRILTQMTVPCSALAETVSVPVPQAHLWNPEDPYLYRITLLLKKDGRTIERCERNAGLRTIQKNGQQVLFNGTPLKLRGLAYREPLPAEGFDPAADLRLFKEANVNYLRSLYYPFDEALLRLCDEAGILVEQSAPVDQVGQALPANQNAPALRPLFLEQHREMLLSGRSHPCILLWSLGNESVWGDQFRQELALTKELDPDRLINFHFPMTVPQEDWVPDVWSLQYGAWNLESDVCYDQMIIFHTHGADNPIGYATGKAQDYHLPVLHDAYAPVPVYDLDALEKEDGIHEFWGESLSRFWRNIRNTPGALGGAVMAAVDEDGVLFPSLCGYRYGILDSSHRPKPEYWHVKMAYREDPFSMEKLPGLWRITNSAVRCELDPATGLLTGLWLHGKKLLSAGPFLHTGRFRLDPWKLSSLDTKRAEKAIRIRICGSYGEICTVSFVLDLTEAGELNTSCRIEELNRPMPHQVKSGIGLDPGGLDEWGIRYLLPSDMNTLQWSRRALWPEYPSGHIGRPRGTADRSSRSDFTSLKANITDASVSSPSGTVRILPEGPLSLRLRPDAQPCCILDDREDANELAQVSWDGSWHLVTDRAGLANETETMSREENASCTVRFTGTGLIVYGSTDRIRGCCDIWLDGSLAARNVSQHTPAVQVPAMSRGYEKRYHTVLFSVDSLPMGEHECRIVVTGTKEPASQEAYISIDSFEVLHPDFPKELSLILCRDYNYPRLTQGNYMRPAVMVQAKDEVSCHLSFEEKGGVE